MHLKLIRHVNVLQDHTLIAMKGRNIYCWKTLSFFKRIVICTLQLITTIYYTENRIQWKSCVFIVKNKRFSELKNHFQCKCCKSIANERKKKVIYGKCLFMYFPFKLRKLLLLLTKQQKQQLFRTYKATFSARF